MSEMLANAPAGRYIRVFPFWPSAEPASFRRLMVKGGFRVSAAYKPGRGVLEPVTIASTNRGIDVQLVSPWPGSAVNVVEVLPTGVTRNVTKLTVSSTPAGTAFVWSVEQTSQGYYEVYRASAVATTSPPTGHVAPPPVACTAYNNNCTACIAASDQRPVWASPCVFLSGPSEDGARCQPSKWWYPPYDSMEKYPHVHACASCAQPTAACPLRPSPSPPPPAPPAVCPMQ